MNTGNDFILMKKIYKVGTILCYQGEMSDDIYILQQGAIQVIVNNMVVAVISVRGSFFGESAAFTKKPRSATLKVIEEAHCMIIPSQFIGNVIQQSPQIGIQLVKILAKRLKTTTEYLTRLQSDIIKYRNEIRQLKGETVLKELSFEDKMLELGFINSGQMEEAKQISATEGRSLMQILFEKKYITLDEISKLLEI